MSKQKVEIDTIDSQDNIEITVIHYDTNNYTYNQYYKRLSFANYLSGPNVDTSEPVCIQFESFVNNYLQNKLKITQLRVFVDDLLIKTYNNCSDVDYSIDIMKAYNSTTMTIETSGVGTVESLKIILT